MSYIEREALLKNSHTYSMEFGEYIGEDVRDVDAILTDRVKEAPAADVVHCRDCKHISEFPCPARDCHSGRTKNCVAYCSMGERRESEETNG